jgi:RNA polymerase sigma factor (sigma-70 family)
MSPDAPLTVVAPPSAVSATEAPLTAEQQRLVVSVLRFIEHRIHQVAPRLRGPARDDLVQACRLGAAHAARRFDASRGLRFVTFAGPHIGGALADHIRRERKQSAPIRAASAAARAFLADEIDPVDVLIEPEDHRRRFNTLATRMLSAMIAGLAETTPSAEDTLIDRQCRRLARETVEQTLARVGEAERAIYKRRYVEGRLLYELTGELGVSLATVRRQHERFLDENARALHARGVTELPPPGDD